MLNFKKHMNLLGMRVEDRVTGFKGVVASVTFDLYGCIQALVNPGMDSAGKLQDSTWLDVGRLLVVSDEPVMARPAFDWSDEAVSAGEKGPAERPTYNKA